MNGPFFQTRPLLTFSGVPNVPLSSCNLFTATVANVVFSSLRRAQVEDVRLTTPLTTFEFTNRHSFLEAHCVHGDIGPDLFGNIEVTLGEIGSERDTMRLLMNENGERHAKIDQVNAPDAYTLILSGPLNILVVECHNLQALHQRLTVLSFEQPSHSSINHLTSPRQDGLLITNKVIPREPLADVTALLDLRFLS